MASTDSSFSTPGRIRLDKWLWAARFFKTRTLGGEAIALGRVAVNGQTTKASREVKVGDTLDIRIGPLTRTVVVRALSGLRGPASMAAQLYEETEASRARRAALLEQQRMAPEPGLDHDLGRPTKRQRRDLERWREGADSGPPAWDDRWSASLDR